MAEQMCNDFTYKATAGRAFLPHFLFARTKIFSMCEVNVDRLTGFMAHFEQTAKWNGSTRTCSVSHAQQKQKQMDLDLELSLSK